SATNWPTSSLPGSCRRSSRGWRTRTARCPATRTPSAAVASPASSSVRGRATSRPTRRSRSRTCATTSTRSSAPTTSCCCATRPTSCASSPSSSAEEEGTMAATTTAPTDDLTAEVTAWLEEHWDPDLTVEEWWARLGPSGWAVPTWPVEWYGKGLSRAEGVRVMQTISGFPALGAPGGLGTLLAGPTIYTHGTGEAQARDPHDIVHGHETRG